MRRYVVIPYVLHCICLVEYSYYCFEVPKAENLDCYTNFADLLSCFWYKGSHPGNGPFNLTLKDLGNVTIDYMCTLVSSPYDKSFSCNITYEPGETDCYSILVQDTSSEETLTILEEFCSYYNIKLDPPSNVSYHFTGNVYTITWSGNRDFSGSSNILYELKIKKGESGEETLKTVIFDQYVDMFVSDFHEGSNYIQIRCTVEDQQDYKSQWSEWSSEIRIDVFVREKQDLIYIITVVTLLSMTLILLFLALRSNLALRMNISFLEKIPTAADFFHPLYHIHNGNFQDWITYQNKYKENGKKDQNIHNFPQDPDLYSTTVLYVQREVVSSVELEAPLSKEDIVLAQDSCSSMSWSDLLEDKEISVNGVYPQFFSSFPSFSNAIMEDNDAVCSLDCPTDYVSYDGNYIANSQEIVD